MAASLQAEEVQPQNLNWYKNYQLKANSITAPIFDTKMVYYTLNDHFIDKPSIVLIHGVGGSAADFEPLVPLLARHYRLIIVDLPGYGLSDKAKSVYAPANYAASWAQGIRQIKNQPTYSIGHSMGGNITLQIINQAPELAKKIVLIEAAGMLHKYAYSKYVALDKIDDIKYINQKNQNIFAGIIDKINQALPDFTDMVLSKKSREHLLKNNTTYISAISVMHEDLTDILRQVNTQSLIIWGKEDAVMPYQTAYMLKHFIQQNEFEIIDGAGHSPQKDQPEMVFSAIHQYLNQPLQTTKQKIGLPRKANHTIVDCNNKNTQVDLPLMDYQKLTILNCPGIELHRLTADELHISNSTVDLFNIEINSDSTALNLSKSRVVIWGGSIQGTLAFDLQRSQLDLVGVDLYVEKLAGEADKKSQVLASVSRLNKQDGQENWHGFVKKSR